jgi:hypothetical protein
MRSPRRTQLRPLRHRQALTMSGGRFVLCACAWCVCYVCSCVRVSFVCVWSVCASVRVCVYVHLCVPACLHVFARAACRHLNVLKHYLAVFTAVGDADSTFAKNAAKAYAAYSAAFKSSKTPASAPSIKLDTVSAAQ